MKKNLIAVVITFCNCLIILAQWSEQTVIPTPPKLNCVSASYHFDEMVYPNEVWIGGDSGTILYTSNSGIYWLYRNNSMVNNSNVYVIKAIGNPFYFLTSGKALCSANSSTMTYIYRTSNQGLNWSIVYQQSGGRIRGIEMLDSINGYVVGDPVGGRWTILRTTNGGLDFDSTGLYLIQNGSEISNYNSLYLGPNPNVFMFGTNNSRLYRSTNSGLNWSSINLSFQNDYAVTLGGYDDGGIQEFSSGFAAGNNAVYTSNYGQTWSSVTLPGTGDIHSFYYNLCGPYYACYTKGSQIYSSTNSSLQFFLDYISPGGGYYTHMCIGMQTFEGGQILGWAVTDRGSISTYHISFIGIKKISSEVPDKFSLFQNYPNPFNPSTKIDYQITKNCNVKLTIYDVLGKEIAVLVNENETPGIYETQWDGSNYSSGIYFYKLETGSYSETRKMVLIK